MTTTERTKLTRESLAELRKELAPLMKEKLDAKDGVDNTGEYPRLTGKFYEKQIRRALRNYGIIDPYEVNDYIALGGYRGLEKALFEMKSQEIIDEVKNAGIRGLGGAGFPTGIKWQGAADQPEGKKYLIVNGDEGDPGAYMDRAVMEGDPHAVLEGMAICGRAIGSDEGFIYVRAEYPTAVKALTNAIKQAEEVGLLGDNILGSDFSFRVSLRLGSGAFVCGEGTALMESIEGRRGMPRAKVQRTYVSGLWDKPTIINNVETISNIAQIIDFGAGRFRSAGTPESPGTKVFALVGKVKNAGLVEVPMGITINELVNDIGDGVGEGKKVKAVQTGGPSGGCIPSRLFDTPLDFDSLAKIGSIMGSGGLVVMDDTDCMVDIARFFIEFSVDESCGKCTPCRDGTMRMFEILTRITEGQGTEEDLEDLRFLGELSTNTSLCGLGQTAANPILSTLQYFEDEYLAHVHEKNCPAGACKALASYTINKDICIGCGACKRKCPVEAITGQVKGAHVIDQDTCIKCGNCMDVCPVGAVELK
ncbi:MAG: 4Fe-4S binding protein [Tissierellia bacterium]|nr:4Fe-4S binding protein [Tissierellia bacterium]